MADREYKEGEKIEITKGMTVGGPLSGYEVELTGWVLDFANAVRAEVLREARFEALWEDIADCCGALAMPRTGLSFTCGLPRGHDGKHLSLHDGGCVWLGDRGSRLGLDEFHGLRIQTPAANRSEDGNND